jgi:uncharacterized protein (TIGR02145 family)
MIKVFRMKKYFLSLMIIFVGHTFNSQLYSPGSGVTDIDGNSYQTIIINGQEWMKQNLKVSKYSNGVIIPSDSNFFNENIVDSLNTGAWINYNNNNQLMNIYGKLYNWYSVVDPKGLCPYGWNVPNESNWNELIDFLDPGNNHFSEAFQSQFAGGMLKEVGTQHWLTPNAGATNVSGFTALPAGNYMGGFNDLETHSFWWSSNQRNSSQGWIRGVRSSSEDLSRYAHGKGAGLSVRCIKNNTSSLNNINLNNKILIKITDLLGREIFPTTNEIFLFHYNDGSVEKKMVME